MKRTLSFIKKGVAMFLSIAVCLTGVNFAFVAPAFAAEPAQTMSVGTVMANAYADDLSATEEKVLKSGMLYGSDTVITYDRIQESDDLVSIDTDAKKITALTYTEDGKGENPDYDYIWKPVSFDIVAGGTIEESGSFTGTTATYTYDGNAFSVKVTYDLHIPVDEPAQKDMLNALNTLPEGIEYITDLYNVQGFVTIVEAEQVMDILVDLANGGITVELGGGGSVTAGINSEAGKNAVNNTLRPQWEANGGEFNLTAELDGYRKKTNGVKYLVEKGAAIKTAAKDIAAAFQALLKDPLFNNELVINNVSQVEDLIEAMEAWLDATEDALDAEWTAADKKTVVDGLNDDQYEELSADVAKLNGKADTDIVVTEPVAEDVVLNKNLSMLDVEVSYILKHTKDEVGSKELVEVGSPCKTTIQVAENATKAEVLAEITAKGLEDAAIAKWGDKLVDGQYEPTVTTDLPATVTEDTAYVVTFVPKEYTITYGDGFTPGTEKVPYGYQLLLEEHSGSKVYDYFVDNVYYPQGKIIPVASNVKVTRETGKAYTTEDLYKLISNQFGLADEDKTILMSGAVKGNENIPVRYPDTDGGTLAWAEDGETTLATTTYPSGYKGLVWKAYSYSIDGGAKKYFDGASSVTVPAGWNQIDVFFRLDLTNFSVDRVADALDMPKELVAEAKTQLESIERINSNTIYNNLASLDKTKFGALKGVIDVSDLTGGKGDNSPENLALRAEFGEILIGIQEDCLGTSGKLKLYEYLTAYRNGGLTYYYRNHAAFREEINVLSGYLSRMLDKQKALEVLLEANGLGDYKDRIQNVSDVMNEVKAGLTAPNAKIDTTSEQLPILTAALTSAATGGSYTAAPLYLESSNFTVTSSGKVGVKVTIEIKDGTSVVAYNDTFTVGTVLTQGDVDKIMDDVETKKASLGDLTHYKAPNMSELQGLVGTELKAGVKYNYTYTWTVADYTVNFGWDGTSEKVNVNDLIVDLPASQDANIRYEYNVWGKTVQAGPYVFTLADLTKIKNESLTITRTEIDLAKEKLDKMIASLNSAGGDSIKFELTEVGGKKQIAVTLDPANAGFKSAVTGAAMGLLDSGYSYIGINGQPFVYMKDGALEVSLQTLVNAGLADTTLSSTSITAKIASDGKILDPQLIKATMELGTSQTEIAENTVFMVKLASAPSQLVKVRNAIAKFDKYIYFESDGEKLAVELTLPEKVYEVYLAALLATGNVDKTDVNAVNKELACNFLKDYVDVLLGADVSTTTYEKTLAKLGKTKDLSGYEDYFKMVSKLYSGKVSTSKDGFVLNVNFTAEQLKGFIKNDTMTSVLKECKDGSEGLFIGAEAELTNFDSKFQALVLDVEAAKASGVKAKLNAADFTTDLAARLAEVKGQSMVVLLADYTGKDLVFTGKTLLDLNGYTINAGISTSGNGDVTIVSSAMDTVNAGGVNGSVSGNFHIQAGNYTANVEAMLNEGYVMDGNAVVNKLYNIVANDKEVIFQLNSNILAADIALSKDLAFNIALDLGLDVLLNYYTSASMSMGSGMDIYEFKLTELLDLYTAKNRGAQAIQMLLDTVNTAGLSQFVNTLAEDLMKFDVIAASISADGTSSTPFVSYDMTVAPWDIDIVHDKAEDHMDVSVVANKSLAKTKAVKLQFIGDRMLEIKALAEELDVIVLDETELKMNLEPLTYANGKVSVTADGTAVVKLDLTEKSDYAVIIGVLLGSNMTGADKTAARKAVEAFYNNGGDVAELKKIFDKATVTQVFTALKKMSAGVDFTKMAKNLGVKSSILNSNEFKQTAAIEKAYHKLFVAAGALLERFDVTGGGRTMGSMESSDYGRYVIDKSNVNRTGSKNVYSGYGVAYDLTINDIALDVKVFEEAAHYACVVYDDNNNFVAGYDTFTEAWAEASKHQHYAVQVNEDMQISGTFGTAKVNGIIGTDKLSGDYIFRLAAKNAAIHVLQGESLATVVSGVEGYRVNFAFDGADDVYSLVEISKPTENSDKIYAVDVDKLSSQRILVLDQQCDGVAIKDLSNSLKYRDLAGYDLSLKVTGKRNSALIATEDTLRVEASKNGVVHAFIEYKVVVLGDTSCNGQVSSNDASQMMAIFFDGTNKKYVKIAADANVSGTFKAPHVSSYDASWIMNKYFDGENYTSNLGK